MLDALADPDSPRRRPRALSDLRVLASASTISATAVAPPPPPPPVVTVAAPPPAPAPARNFLKVYQPEDAGVAPPTVVRQAFPPFPGKVLTGGVGMLEVVVDATGAVESATMVVSVHPQYTASVCSAALAVT